MNKKKNPPLKELVDLIELQTIQDNFAEAVGASSVIFSPEGEPLTEFSNPTRFCSLIQSTAAGKQRCFQSFQEMAGDARGSEEPRILYCFAHGGYFVAPIVIDGEHKGTMFAGQFIPSEFSEEQLDDIRQIAGEIDMDPGTLLAEAEQMRVVREDVVRNYSSLLFRIVGIIAKLGVQAAELAEANAGLQQEIAERKSAEGALSRSEEKYRDIIENIQGVFYRCDMNGNLAMASPSGARLLGYDSVEEILGANIAATFYAVSEERDSFLKILEEKGSVNNYEVTLKKRDGTLVPTLTSSHLYFDEDGDPLGVEGILSDITERKELERELQQAFDKLKASYVELSTPVIQVWDNVLMLPIIGVLDSERINRLMETMLAKIVKTHSRVVIIDVTGVRSVDTNVASHLIDVMKAAKLLGTTCIITGIKPEAAHTLVGLGVDMSEITTKRSMQEGLKYALQIAGAGGVDA